MKHLKTFENIKLKIYIICDDIRTVGLSIYQVILDRNRDITLRIVYRYDNGEEQRFIKDMVYYGKKREDLNIHYQTDDLDDAINKIKIIDKSSKYNI